MQDHYVVTLLDKTIFLKRLHDLVEALAARGLVGFRKHTFLGMSRNQSVAQERLEFLDALVRTATGRQNLVEYVVVVVGRKQRLGLHILDDARRAAAAAKVTWVRERRNGG